MHHEEVIFAALQEINASIKAGSKALSHLTDRLTIIERKLETMSDSTKTVLDAFTTELNALIARAATNSVAAADLTEVLAQLQSLTAQAHTAATV